MDEDLSIPISKVDGSCVYIDELDKTFDLWVHSGPQIKIETCAPSSEVAIKKIRDPNVYPITSHTRGRVLLISNTGYQALKLLRVLFEQLDYTICIHAEKSNQQFRDILHYEAGKGDNKDLDSFVIIIYGTPVNFDLSELLKETTVPALRGKPKLIYVTGDETNVQQVFQIAQTNNDPDYFLAVTDEPVCRQTQIFSSESLYFDQRVFPGLTSSVLPEEIQKMDPGDIELYMKMLESSKMSTYNVRLMFVGLFGAGKTCTARRIMSKEIDDVSSTDGIDVYIGKCKVNIESDSWETLEDSRFNMPCTQLSQLMLTDDESESKVPDIKHLENKDEEQIVQQQGHEETLYQRESRYLRFGTRSGEYLLNESSKRRRTNDILMSSPQSNEPMDSEQSSVASTSSVGQKLSSLSVDRSRCEFMNTAYKVIKQTHATKTPKKKEAFVSLWDFAGQFVYYATHQLFFSPRSIYLLVLNMEDDFEKTLIEDWFFDLSGKESIDSNGGVRFWLQSIYTYSKGSQPGIPPIILVGTHKDKLPGNENQKQSAAKDYFNRITNYFEGTPLQHHIQNTRFLLDNTRTDPDIGKLKKKIMAISKTMPYWGEQIPAKWVELEQALEDRRIDGTTFIKMEELKTIDKNIAKPIGEKEQLELFLRFHHETGTLIFFHDASNLSDIIVLEPQWIINAFRCLISAEKFGKKYGELEDAWKNFMNSGQLEIKLAVAIWGQDRQHHFFENHEMLLHFLEKLDIIARAKTITKDGNYMVLPFYYVPCLLKQPPNTELLKMPIRSDCISTPVLCYTFKDKFLPPAVFNRLLAICLGMWPVAKQGKKIYIFCGCAVFVVGHGKDQDTHRLTLFFKKSKIGVRITRYSSKPERTVDLSICDTVRRKISCAISKELVRYQTKTTQSKTPFTYKLQCKKTNENDQLDEGLYNVDDLVENIDTDFYCEQHSDMVHPHSLSAVGMLQEWFPNKIPPNFRITSVSSVDLWAEKLPDLIKKEEVTNATLSKISNAIGKNWQILMLELGVEQVKLDQEQENYSHNVRSQIYHSLCYWKDKLLKADTKPTNEMLIKAIKICESSDLTVNWEEVQNIVDGFM